MEKDTCKYLWVVGISINCQLSVVGVFNIDVSECTCDVPVSMVFVSSFALLGCTCGSVCFVLFFKDFDCEHEYKWIWVGYYIFLW